MPSLDSPAVIVARFLKANHYTDTLDAFLREAGLPPDAGKVEQGDLTIEKILEEKKIFDLSLSFEKIDAGDNERGWKHPAPSSPHQITALASAANFLHVSVESLKDASSQSPLQLLLATTADRRLHLIKPDPGFSLVRSLDHVHDSPILSCACVGTRYLTTVSTSMSGQVVLYDHKADKALEERRDHSKYVVKVVVWEDGHVIWVATAGWDAKVYIYTIREQEALQLGPPLTCISLSTNPESITFVDHPDFRQPILVATRRDSTSLHYYLLPTIEDNPAIPTTGPPELKLLGLQNLTPHSNAWIAFSPSSVAVCPTDPTLVAVATSAVPHMKLIVVRILVPSSATIVDPISQAAQSRANLAVQDRESAAIQLQINTLAPQTSYSTPQAVWRPDGSGVWVNGDDGALRGVEIRTGKVVATLKDGHKAGSKIRSIWCGMVDGDAGKEEWVVSGGFDRKLIVWRPE